MNSHPRYCYFKQAGAKYRKGWYAGIIPFGKVHSSAKERKMRIFRIFVKATNAFGFLLLIRNPNP
jgi:hypothetical protein